MSHQSRNECIAKRTIHVANTTEVKMDFLGKRDVWLNFNCSKIRRLLSRRAVRAANVKNTNRECHKNIPVKSSRPIKPALRFAISSDSAKLLRLSSGIVMAHNVPHTEASATSILSACPVRWNPRFENMQKSPHVTFANPLKSVNPTPALTGSPQPLLRWVLLETWDSIAFRMASVSLIPACHTGDPHVSKLWAIPIP